LHNISLIVSCCKQGICLVQVITLKMLLSPWFRQTIQNICTTNDSRYFPILVSITWSFLHSWLITGFVTRVARRVPLVVHELLTFPENMGSSPVCSGIRVARSLVFCVVNWWSSFVLLSFYLWALCFRSLDLWILITPLFSSNYAYNYSWWYSMYIHILDLYFRQASLSPKQNFGTIENRDFKTSLRNHWQ
jgi:hypothetical protein